MFTYFDLRQHLYAITDKVRDGHLKVTGIHDYGDRLIVVVAAINAGPSTLVKVIDTTKEPMEPQILEVEAVEEVEQISQAQVEITPEETAVCKYCGKKFSKRGLTRHENKCSGG